MINAIKVAWLKWLRAREEARIDELEIIYRRERYLIDCHLHDIDSRIFALTVEGSQQRLRAIK